MEKKLSKLNNLNSELLNKVQLLKYYWIYILKSYQIIFIDFKYYYTKDYNVDLIGSCLILSKSIKVYLNVNYMSYYPPYKLLY